MIQVMLTSSSPCASNICISTVFHHRTRAIKYIFVDCPVEYHTSEEILTISVISFLPVEKVEKGEKKTVEDAIPNNGMRKFSQRMNKRQLGEHNK